MTYLQILGAVMVGGILGAVIGRGIIDMVKIDSRMSIYLFISFILGLLLLLTN